jgi:hypothetical protein
MITPPLQPQQARGLRISEIGAMTAVMRAAAVRPGAEALRVPRIAMVVGGRIVDERLFRDASAITVGTAEDATFTVAGPSLPERFVLIERVDSKHYLRFVEGMSGRVALGNERHELAALKDRAHEARGAHRVELPNDARGKIVLGDVTFLFQLVPAPPMPTTPRLPLGVLDGIGGSVDWRLAIIAAMSFLVHFAFVGGAYSDWMDPVVDSDRSVAALIDMKRNLPDVPVEDPKTATATPTNDAPPATPKKEDGVATNKGPRGAMHPTRKPSATSDEQAADLAARAKAIEVGMIASIEGGPATKTAIDRNSEIPPVDLTAAAKSAEGATHDHDPLGARRAGGPVKAGKDGLANLAPGTRGDANDGPGKESNAPAGPSLTVDIRPPTITGPAVSDADRVIAKLRPRFRKCYESGLTSNPSMSGKTVLAARVQPNGEVASVDVAENQGLTPAVTSCMARVLSNAQFTGNGSFSTVRVPVTMIQQP